jgi:hypothetical protein
MAGVPGDGPSRMNYYNYFTEIEETFVRRRGSHIHVSPLDWSLIETWRERGIPLEVAIRGINTAFDAYDQSTRRGRKVNSLFYCQQEVEAQFQVYSEARVGEAGKSELESPDPASPFAPEAISQFLSERAEDLNHLAAAQLGQERLAEVFSRAARRTNEITAVLRETKTVDPERLENDLTQIERVLLEGLRDNLGVEERAQLRSEAEQQLKGYKQRMGPEVYEQTLENYFARRLREKYHVPRLSLFYM